jgi:hypothetical protein
MGSEASSVSAAASPLSSDKRASIYDFIFTFEEKKRAKKKVKVVPKKKGEAILELSPLTAFMRACV